MTVSTGNERVRSAAVTLSARKRPVKALSSARRLLVPVLLVVLWEVAARMGAIDTRFIAAPTQVMVAWWEWIVAPEGAPAADPYVGTWLEHAWSSIHRVVLGFFLAAVFGVSVGVLIGWFTLAEDLFDGVIQVLRPIPVTSYVPFAIIFFGINWSAAVFLIALGAFFPIAVNTIAGVQRVPKQYTRAARMLGTPESRLLPWVAFPAALPSIMTGLRVGVGLAWVLVIVAEMVAVKSGLGYVLWDAYYFLRMDIIIAAMFSVGILGFLSDRIILRVSNYVLRWHEGRA